MAASTLLDRAEKTEVYYNFGKFYNDQRGRFVKAPFDLVKIDGIQYVMPKSVAGTAAELDTVIAGDTSTPEYFLGRDDFGFSNLTPMVMNENEMGDYSSDTFKAVHRFGFI